MAVTAAMLSDQKSMWLLDISEFQMCTTVTVGKTSNSAKFFVRLEDCYACDQASDIHKDSTKAVCPRGFGEQLHIAVIHLILQ